MAHATGDEKHDESSTSTLDALAVLLRRRLARRSGEPGPGPSATGSSSAKGTGRSRTTRSSRTWGSSPESWLRRLHGLGRQARESPRPRARPGRRGLDRLARPRSPDVDRRRAGAPRAGPHRAAGDRPDRRRGAERGLELGGDPARAGAAAHEPHAPRDRQPQQQPADGRRGTRSSGAFGWSATRRRRSRSRGAAERRSRERDERRPTAVVADIPEGEW